ncbi:hypothetical protein FRC04_005708 [Tulasnella sp. 424]|nr:hypothetical protein FRC04_005708 [Tulasnella sp. 424]KAG8977504.1 hypothetical protein FRC05_001362 [Tulasnella sp. 425]
MQSTQCFCSNPVFVTSDSEDDYESHIYCSRACALSDAFRALTARQATPGPGDIVGSSRLALTQEQLGYVTHYRRIVRRGGVPPALSGKFVQPTASPRSSGSQEVSTSPTSASDSPPTSANSSISSLEYLDTKPLPSIPRRETHILRAKKTRHNLKEETQSQAPEAQAQPSFRRNISNRYPPVKTQAPPVHNRNSSLSSFADSSRFTTQTVSTRATSVVSSCPDDGVHVMSRNPSTRGSVDRLRRLPEEEEPVEVPGLAWAPGNGRMDRSRDVEVLVGTNEHSGCIDLTSPVARSVWEIGSSYDPFELDQLMMHTPRVYAEPGRCSADVSLEPVTPLNVPFRSQLPYQLSPVQELPGPDGVLAPAIELGRMPKRSTPNEPRPEPTGLAPPPSSFGSRLQPASPSAFPTTPSLSPLGCTPTASPQQVMEPTPKGPAFKSLTYSPPSVTGTTFTLHRRRRPDLGGQGARPLGLPGILNPPTSGVGLPITPLDPQEEVAGYFERNPVLGPGNPLFLEPLAGLGFEIDESRSTRRNVVSRLDPGQKMVAFESRQREAPGVTDALQRAATVHTSAKCSGESSPADDVLDYYLGVDDAHSSNRRTFNFV